MSGKETRAVRRLRARLDEARQLHGLTDDPLLRAVRMERFRVSVTRSLWFFLALGLGFTTTGVHEFLAGQLDPAHPMWWGAWLVEPGLAGILITLLRWEAEMLARGLDADARPVHWLKRLLLGATLITNVWASLRPATGGINAGMVFLHLVIPLVVFLIAEVMPVIQHRCATARPEPAPTVPAPRPALKLPAHLQNALSSKAAQVRSEGRPVTPADVQAAVNVPDAYAARLAAQLNQ
ncbi:hypothetical protein Amir_1115 [Actinosynnema mirum DSM 43827]|uniref:DUF2637 domain-containing protein n=2 Tax=Actinosynnema mirum TaxID=40567 RepID=C6WQ15_ACTMD|nr:hypothetical protein Amir_1115 [Actinosynnema mirum DSM 43827]